MSRVPAFTLIEVLLSLLLVVILGTIATYALGGTLRDLDDTGTISGRQLQVLWAGQRVRIDMDEAATVQVEANGAVVFDGPAGRIHYEQRGDTLVRSGGPGEEVRIAVRSASTKEVMGTPGLIADWVLQLDDPAQAGPLIFHKEYDARTLLRYLIDHADTRTSVP